MLTAIIGLAAIMLVGWLCFKFAGLALAAAFYIFVEIPIGFCLLLMGFIFCCTILLIPFGKSLMKVGIGLMLPG